MNGLFNNDTQSLSEILAEIDSPQPQFTLWVRALLKRPKGEKILAAIKPGNLAIALDVKGQPYSTEQLSEQLKNWQMGG